MLIGYARVSTQDQNPELQTEALRKAGCEKIFTDKASGADRQRPQLAKAIGFARQGDAFVCWKLDRVARSLAHLLAIAEGLEAKGVAFRSLTEAIDTSTPAGRMTFQVIGAIAEFERSLIRERVVAGLANARANGRIGGRRPVLDEQKIDAARVMRAAGMKMPDIIAQLGCCRSTYYVSLRKDRHAEGQ